MKRDEAKHEAEEREKKRKQRAVEGERRLKRLKNDQSAGDSRKESNEHINFFEVSSNRSRFQSFIVPNGK